MKALQRSCGVLLHPTSLPGPEGMGTLGRPARAFVDRLAESRQSWWQILPLNPPGFGGSPYSSDSAYAGNPNLVALRRLVDRDLLTDSEWSDYCELLPSRESDRYDIGTVHAARKSLLGRAFERWRSTGHPARRAFENFCESNGWWLEDYALFKAIKRNRDGADWRSWPDPLTRRDSRALEEASERLSEDIERVRFEQWLFDRQWNALRDYADDRGVRILGDAPIFVAMDSADVWANREYFRVGPSGQPDVVAGVPPDYFSETGQKWGNPLYDWEALADDGFEWWLRRVDRVMETVDLVRIDHFRGFEACWAVPADAPTAETGEWIDGPGDSFFDAVDESFGDVPFVAEDLGTIDDAVRALRDRHELPGMKVMQFAFDGSDDHPFLPHTYPTKCVAYTGTHDNDTSKGWYQSADESTRSQVQSYLSVDDDRVVRGMMEAITESDAALSMFPAQDILELGSEARMNTPGTVEDNWNWRMTSEQLDHPAWSWLADQTSRTGRDRPGDSSSPTPEPS